MKFFEIWFLHKSMLINI